jgi:peptidoglycan/LPS O-acetylase OafA/YrhL
MNITQSVNRTVNLIGVTISGIAAVAFGPEAISETEWQFKVDDALIVLLGIGAIVWYLRAGNRYMHSLVPILFVGAALVLKVFAIIVEFADPEDVGDDFGGLIIFVVATGVLIYQYMNAAKTAESG